MRARTRTILAALLTAALAAVGSAALAADLDGRGGKGAIEMTAREAMAAEQEAAQMDPAVALVEYWRMADCDPAAKVDGTCFPGSPDEMAGRACMEGDPLRPLWRRTRSAPNAPWGPWQLIVNWTCPEDYRDAPTFTLEDFRRLPLAPPQLNVQPARAEHLVNMPAIVYTTPSTQTFTTDLLGYTFEVQATPTSYTWDFGDGSVITTTDPGAPYPHHTISHTYQALGDFTITLTTGWSGRYHLAGEADWRDVVGTATTSAATTITTVESRTHLVGADCNQDPHGPWCEG